MKKLTCVLAIVAAASTAAVAKDLKQDNKTTSAAVAATQMSDTEMDKVTAGQNGFGVETAVFFGSASNAAADVQNKVNLVNQGNANAAVDVAPGHGMLAR
jgi:hypothetical protein